MPLYLCRLEQEEPYVTHFRQMELTFTAKDIEQASEMVNDMLVALHLGKVEIVELYRDNNAKVW